MKSLENFFVKILRMLFSPIINKNGYLKLPGNKRVGFIKNILLAVIVVIFFLLLGGWFFFNKNNSPKSLSTLSEPEARAIAEKSCIKGGEALGPGGYNENSKAWWFDANLNATREGCNSACVVSEGTKTAEINWRCTGLKEPK